MSNAPNSTNGGNSSITNNTNSTLLNSQAGPQHHLTQHSHQQLQLGLSSGNTSDLNSLVGHHQHSAHQQTPNSHHELSTCQQQSAQIHLSNLLGDNLTATGGLGSTNPSSLMSGSHPSSKGGSIPQMPGLSAVAYSHLHSVMGSMPIYDMSDYQHL